MTNRRGNAALLVATVFALLTVMLLGASRAWAAIEGTALITAPAANAQVSGSVVVQGTATAVDFQFYKLEFGQGAAPAEWSVIGDLHYAQVTNGTLGTWDVTGLAEGAYTLKLTVVDITGNYLEHAVPVTVVRGGQPAGPAQPPACARPVPANSLMLVPLTVPSGSAGPGGAGQGTIQGRVTGVSGQGLCGLTVRASGAGAQRTAVTDEDGRYEIRDLAPGTYSVVVERQTCTPASGLRVAAGQAFRVDFVEIRQPSASPSPSGTRLASPTASAGPARTPTPSLPALISAPTPTPSPTPSGRRGVTIWSSLGIDIDLGSIVPHFSAGVMGGAFILAVGFLIVVARRRR